jgi:cytosine/adenosine deaminase-related metal-dependent hydrolase
LAEKGRADLLVSNAYVLTMDDERLIYPQGAIAVRDGAVAAVGPEAQILERFDSDKRVDANGGIVHPGFIESHVHVTQHLFRHAFSGSMTWPDILKFFWGGWLPVITPEQELASSRLACVEMARNGTTSFLEGGTVFDNDAAAAGVTEVGIRGNLADSWVMDRGPVIETQGGARSPQSTDEAISSLGSQLWRNSGPDVLVQGHVCVHGNGWVSDEVQLAAKARADENGVVLNQHQSYNQEIVEEEDTSCGGVHVLKHFSELGIMGENSTFAHMNVVRDDEFVALCEVKPAVAWCPTASMLFGVGGTIKGRHLELYRAGVNVGLGSDAPNWAGSLDVGEQGFIALLTSCEKTGGEGAGLEAEDVLAMATIHGARALGWQDRVGSLEVGKRADLVIRRADLPEAQPPLDPIRSLVSSSRSKSVETVVVNGEIVVEGGHCVRVDEEATYEAARVAAAEMLSQMNYSGTARWPVVE